jgi:hypothetical protein
MTWFKAHNLDQVVLGVNTPSIPSLIKGTVQTIILENGSEITGKIRGNETEVKKAEEDNKAWINKDRIALARLTNSLSDDLLYIVENCVSSQAAWNALYDEFAPSDEATVVTHQSDFFSNHCTIDMDVAQWLTDQRRILTRIKAAGGRIDDKLIVQFILGQLPDESWGSFVDMHARDPEDKSHVGAPGLGGRPMSPDVATVNLSLAFECDDLFYLPKLGHRYAAVGVADIRLPRY